MDKLESEMKTQEHKLEDIDASRKKITVSPCMWKSTAALTSQHLMCFVPLGAETAERSVV